MIGVLSAGMMRTGNLSRLLQEPVVHIAPWRPRPQCDRIAGWGKRPSALKARRWAQREGLPYLTVEDGFLRSMGLGKDEPPMSIVIDDQGIYFDASAPSQLEALIRTSLSDTEIERAQVLGALWREARVSKYNYQRDPVAIPQQPYVLVVDQTYGDASIGYGAADASAFTRMLEAALNENRGCKIVLKTHPDVFSGRKRGHFDLQQLIKRDRIEVLAQDVHPAALLERAQSVYVVTSQLGFEAILWRKRVRTFGMPFYAGWGLTEDELPRPERRCDVSAEQLWYAALVRYPRYSDPETGESCEVERIVAYLGLQRRMRQRFPEVVYGQGFSLWKRPIVRRYLQGSQVRFVRSAARLPVGSTVAVWGTAPIKGASETDLRILRLEDGFLRSVGLGAELVRPLSWVVDGQGIYYDARTPSDLENLLETADFPPALLERAALLRRRLAEGGVTKYNVGKGQWQRPDTPAKVILVPGQFEYDAAIRYGTGNINTNMGLLQAVRKANPHAYVVYKPHPDVTSGLRPGGEGEGRAANWCDEVVTDTPMGLLLLQVDEVHVLTSLAGFEALLRGKTVVTYGRPFYAGWGLTRDVEQCSRRTRNLGIDELTAGTLILYPTYVSRVTGSYTNAEGALEELVAWRTTVGDHLPLWRRLLRSGIRLCTRSGKQWSREAGSRTAANGYYSSKGQ